MRDANCASAADFDFLARSLMNRTASALLRLALLESCKKETWFKPYDCPAAPPVASTMIFFAVANALSSSPLLFVES